MKEQEKGKEQAIENEKGKAKVGEKRQGTTDLGSLQKKKTRATNLIYKAVLHDNGVSTIAGKVYDSMIEPITTFTTVQEVMKKAIEAQLMELKSLVSHAMHVDIQTPMQSAVIDPQGHRHRIISIDLISICRPIEQEGVV